MSARLIVNADDGGLSPTTDAAILRCAREGIVTCASVVVSGESAPAFVRDATTLGIDLGLHLNLTEGRALTGGSCPLTSSDGTFTGPKQAVWEWGRTLDASSEGLVEEVRAQWERLYALGARPSHIDGHNHVHILPPVLRALCEALDEASVFLRMPHEAHLAGTAPFPLAELCARAHTALPECVRTTDAFVGYGFCHAPSQEALLDSLPDAAGATELMVHPGARAGSPFGEAPEREDEAEVLCAPDLRNRIEAQGYQLGTFRELLGESA